MIVLISACALSAHTGGKVLSLRVSDMHCDVLKFLVDSAQPNLSDHQVHTATYAVLSSIRNAPPTLTKRSLLR